MGVLVCQAPEDSEMSLVGLNRLAPSKVGKGHVFLFVSFWGLKSETVVPFHLLS